MKIPFFIIYFCFLFTLFSFADVPEEKIVPTRALDEDLEVRAEVQASFSDGSTPLWLNANRYGLSSLSSCNGYFRASAIRPFDADHKSRRFDVAYGLDMAVTHKYSSDLVVQQAFVEGRWLKGALTIGSKETPMELKNNELSSGSQTFGKNARPVPQIRLSLADWWTLPVLNNWLHIKGHISYGMMTDDNWQARFTGGSSKHTENVLYQSKSGYLKIGNDESASPWTVTLGLETASLFGGISHRLDENGVMHAVKNSSSLKAFWHAFFPGGADAQEVKYPNMEGDVLGSWVGRVDYATDNWTASIYGDHFFEDHSAMFHLDYDGYGTGDEWNVKKDNKYLVYGLKDMMLGAEWKKKKPSWLDDVVFEYIYTKYQSGPIYHDHTEGISDHIGGADNYYNHSIWSGWQHWGQVMGNPLYLSPVYNDDGLIMVKNNRFVAYYFAVGGHPSTQWSYRFKINWQDAMGTYVTPYDGYKHTLNMMAELSYRPLSNSLDGWSVTAAIGMDRGNVHGNNSGIQLTVGKELKVKSASTSYHRK